MTLTTPLFKKNPFHFFQLLALTSGISAGFAVWQGLSGEIWMASFNTVIAILLFWQTVSGLLIYLNGMALDAHHSLANAILHVLEIQHQQITGADPAAAAGAGASTPSGPATPKG